MQRYAVRRSTPTQAADPFGPFGPRRARITHRDEPRYLTPEFDVRQCLEAQRHTGVRASAVERSKRIGANGARELREARRILCGRCAFAAVRFMHVGKQAGTRDSWPTGRDAHAGVPTSTALP
jgi:hypothetical protein